MVVLDVLDGVRDNGNAHVDQISRGHFKHGRRKLLPVFVNLLHRHLSYEVTVAKASYMVSGSSYGSKAENSAMRLRKDIFGWPRG